MFGKRVKYLGWRRVPQETLKDSQKRDGNAGKKARTRRTLNSTIE